MSKFVMLPIDKISKAPWNYKEEDAEMQSKLVSNIRQNGQLENIIVRKSETGYEVVNGNHRLDAFRELGFDEVMCCDVGDITEAHAARIAVETNETKFETDNIKLAKLLESIKVEFSIDDIKSTMPFSDNELSNFTSMLSFNWSAPEMSDPVTDPVAIGAAPQQNESSYQENTGPIVKNSMPDKRTINLSLPSDIAELFEEQLRRVKALLYPDDIPEHVSSELPIQAMLQIIASTPDDKFS